MKDSLYLLVAVKETSKDITYSGVILVGIGAAGSVMFAGVVLYTLWKEMMSSQGTTAIYNKTSTRLMNDSRVKDMLGTPIVAHGELSSRGRRRHISRSTYEKDGAKYLRMVYYLKGSHGKATVQLEMKQVSVLFPSLWGH
ncbi:TIMM21 [Cordylochernes scorpioides]|uniref:Mitochondrial import inner membrane translocase subunit Tim21 n=1 Tax=Cordylochernes scorpioides TaxID=51811 RepID=A0ABY6KX31_9ARAC|nr:TIMM21 [Cordylochernes scorpioides]